MDKVTGGTGKDAATEKKIAEIDARIDEIDQIIKQHQAGQKSRPF